MKKKYISPKFLTVELNSGRICMIIGSGNGDDTTTGNGTDLVKEQYPPISDKNVWDEEW